MAWIDPEGTMLSEMSQSEKGEYHMISHDFTHMWNLKNKVNEQTKLRQAHRYREQTDGCQRRGGLRNWVKSVKGLRNTNWPLQIVKGM